MLVEQRHDELHERERRLDLIVVRLDRFDRLVVLRVLELERLFERELRVELGSRRRQAFHLD